jgi:glycosyltransferase involved in cell wall biosynthesis
VINQTYQDFEYIIIDGGSTDGSVDVILEYQNKITYWISEPDKGIYNAMNKGIEVANGEYCLFLNSGDWLVNDSVINKVLPDFDSETAYISGSILTFTKGNKNILKKHSPPEKINFGQFYFFALPHPSTFIRKDLFSKYGFYNEEFKIVSDWEFFFKTLCIYDESYKKINVDISYFDNNGISSNENFFYLRDIEKSKVRSQNLSKNLCEYIEYQENNNKFTKYKRYSYLKKIENNFILKKITTVVLMIISSLVKDR